MKIKRHQVIIASLIVLGLAFLVIGVLYQKEPTKFFAHSLRTWQEADSVAGYPIPAGNGEFVTAEFEPNLSTMTPLERFRLPTARGFSRFQAEDARAAATGLVLYTGNPAGYPGHAVLLGHRLPDDTILQSFYTGLTSTTARVGQHLPRGATLGNGGALAEVRRGNSIDIAPDEIAGFPLNHKQDSAPANRVPLTEFFAQYGLRNPTPDPLVRIQENNFREALEKQNITTE